MKDEKKLAQIRRIAKKLKDLPKSALQRVDDFSDGVLEARREAGERKSA